jgi:hypothetical protein
MNFFSGGLVMPGVRGRSGGHNRKSREDLNVAGTYRPDRHGASASVLAPTWPVPGAEPPSELLAGLGADGARFLRDVYAEFECGALEGHVLRIAAQALDDAEQARARGDAKTVRASVRQLLAALQRLGLPRPLGGQ